MKVEFTDPLAGKVEVEVDLNHVFTEGTIWCAVAWTMYDDNRLDGGTLSKKALYDATVIQCPELPGAVQRHKELKDTERVLFVRDFLTNHGEKLCPYLESLVGVAAV